MKVRSLFILIIFSRILFSAGNNLGGSYSFANIPASAFSSSLGNSITSGISSPSSLQQNPANIWNNNKFNADLTHYNDPFDAEFLSLFISYGSKKALKKYGSSLYGKSTMI